MYTSTYICIYMYICIYVCIYVCMYIYNLGNYQQQYTITLCFMGVNLIIRWSNSFHCCTLNNWRMITKVLNKPVWLEK